MTGETRFRKRAGWLVAVASGISVSAGVSLPARAADPCDGFTWNVSHERAVFASPPAAVTAAATPGPAPTLEPDKLYEISLTAQDKVSFLCSRLPRRRWRTGLTREWSRCTFPSPASTAYPSEGFWIDVITGNKFTATDDFTGVHECQAPRKIVQYVLPAGGGLVLQFSNASSPSVRVTLTAASN